MPFNRPPHWLRWLIGAVVVLPALAAAGPFVYIHFFNSTPSALSLTPGTGSASASSSPGSTASSGGAATANTAASGAVAGTWTAGSGSVVGYRVNEVLLGQNATAVGRT